MGAQAGPTGNELRNEQIKTNKRGGQARSPDPARTQAYHIFAPLPSSSCLKASTPRGKQTSKVRKKEATGACLSHTPWTNDLCIQLGNKIIPQNTNFPITTNVYTVAYCLNSRAMCQPTTTLKNETRGPASTLPAGLPASISLSLDGRLPQPQPRRPTRAAIFLPS